MAVDEQVKLAFTAVTDLTKQLITLATSIVTLEVTFAKAFLTSTNAIKGTFFVQASWVCFLLSVVAGIWALMAVAGTQANTAPISGTSLYHSNIKYPSMVQVVLFAIGMLATIAFGFAAATP